MIARNRIALMLLTILLLSFSIPNVHGSVIFLWSISNATQGENTNCQNYWIAIGNSLRTSSQHNIGIVTDNGSMNGTTITSVTMYLMFRVAPTTSDDITIGSFSSSTGALVSTLGTIPHGSIPLCTTQAPVNFTITGSIQVNNGQYVGVQYLGRDVADDAQVLQVYFDFNCNSLLLPAVTDYFFATTQSNPASDGDHCPFFGQISGISSHASNVDPATKSIALILPFIFVAIGVVTMMSGTKKSGMGQNNGSDIISYGFAAILIGAGVVMIANIIAGL